MVPSCSSTRQAAGFSCIGSTHLHCVLPVSFHGLGISSPESEHSAVSSGRLSSMLMSGF